MFQPATSLLFVPFSRKATGAPFDEIIATNPSLRAFAENYRDNLYAVSAICGLPAKMGGILAHDRVLNTLTLANVLEAELQVGPQASAPENAMRIRQEAEQKALQEIAKNPISRENALAAAASLAEAFSSTIEELLREGLVLIWGAIEVLASDLFVGILNARPGLLRKLFEDDTARRLFGVKSLPMEVIEERNFDLSACMGELVLKQHAVDNVPSMKAAYRALFPADKDLLEQLGATGLFELNQKRNLIVHRRGIVDKEYRSRVKDPPPLGERLLVVAADLEENLRIAKEVGLALLRAGATVLRSSPGVSGGG